MYKKIVFTSNTTVSKLCLILAMTIFSTIGIFRRYIPLSSGMLAAVRGIVGTIFLLLVFFSKKEKFHADTIKKNLFLLLLSGCFIGINWIFLFESYRYTTVATATLCYYMAPIFVMLVSPFLFKEKMTIKKGLCIVSALIGMVFVSGILTEVPVNDMSQDSQLKGIVFGLLAAAFYASVILLNKKISGVGAYEKTIFQLGSAAITILPYVLLTESFEAMNLTPNILVLIIFVGIVHTGIAYTLYFHSMGDLKAQTIALYSYIDPILAIILSAIILKEHMHPLAIIGAVLILGAAMISEMPESKK
ncbi:MAG: EamA family transporter [Lachnospiraceae bacterium]|nr:EamA family transporter [Lachnospiraceae bacterium]